jgi:hypothetical protein
MILIWSEITFKVIFPRSEKWSLILISDLDLSWDPCSRRWSWSDLKSLLKWSFQGLMIMTMMGDTEALNMILIWFEILFREDDLDLKSLFKWSFQGLMIMTMMGGHWSRESYYGLLCCAKVRWSQTKRCMRGDPFDKPCYDKETAFKYALNMHTACWGLNNPPTSHCKQDWKSFQSSSPYPRALY